MLESVAGKITEGLIHEVINTENDCTITASWVACWVRLLNMIDKGDCINLCFCKATDIQQYVNVIQ